jgi:hypothetical protein
VRLRLALVLAIVAAASAPAVGQQTRAPALAGAELLNSLRGGGFIIYFRHADTDFRQQDVRPVNLADCTTQRNLTDRGRDHARAIGAAIRTLAIPVGPVLASPLCRTVETAELAFGTAERFTALRALLSTIPAAGTNEVVVGHAYPFYALVGGQYLDEGEAAVVRPMGGGFEVISRVGLKEWRELAQLSPKRE